MAYEFGTQPAIIGGCAVADKDGGKQVVVAAGGTTKRAEQQAVDGCAWSFLNSKERHDLVTGENNSRIEVGS